jgi:hypothetical protein
MWNQSFFNFCFLMLLLTVLTARHPYQSLVPTSNAEPDADEQISSTTLRPAQVADAMSFVEKTWGRAMVMREWLMEYNSSQWEIFNAVNRAETDLLEARFHVSNAEVLAAAMSENDRAVKELARAESSLEAVQPLVKNSLDPQLKTVETEITAVERRDAESTFSTSPFENIKTDLDRLIQSVRASQS